MREKSSGELYALKKIRMEVEESGGFPVTSIREVKLLQQLAHENVIRLREVVVGYKQTKQVPSSHPLSL